MLKKRNPALFNSLGTAFKIVFVTYQVLATLPSIIPKFELPENLLDFLDKIKFTNLNFFQIIPIRCIAKSVSFDYFDMLLAISLTPIAIVALLCSVAAVWKKHRNFLVTIALAVTYVVLPTVTTAIFGAFPCDVMNEGRESYLRADYSLSCLSDRYQALRAYAITLVLLFPLGIPVIYFFILWTRREKIQQRADVRAQDEGLMMVAFLFESYSPSCWWFEIFETGRRLSLTGVLAAVAPGTMLQLAAGLFVSVVGLCVYCIVTPYEFSRNNWVAILSNVQVFLVMLASMIMKYNSAENGRDGGEGKEPVSFSGLGAFLIFVNLSGLLTLVCVVALQFFVPPSLGEGGKRRAASIFEVLSLMQFLQNRGGKNVIVRTYTQGGSVSSRNSDRGSSATPEPEHHIGGSSGSIGSIDGSVSGSPKGGILKGLVYDRTRTKSDFAAHNPMVAGLKHPHFDDQTL